MNQKKRKELPLQNLHAMLEKLRNELDQAWNESDACIKAIEKLLNPEA